MSLNILVWVFQSSQGIPPISTEKTETIEVSGSTSFCEALIFRPQQHDLLRAPTQETLPDSVMLSS